MGAKVKGGGPLSANVSEVLSFILKAVKLENRRNQFENTHFFVKYPEKSGRVRGIRLCPKKEGIFYAYPLLELI